MVSIVTLRNEGTQNLVQVLNRVYVRRNPHELRILEIRGSRENSFML